MKGFAPIIGVIVVAIFSIAVIIMSIMPVIFLKVHMIKIIDQQYRYNNAQQALLTLLSTNALSQLSEHIVLNIPSDTKFLEEKLDKITTTQCYVLSTQEKSILSKGSCSPEYKSTNKIPLPYNPNSQNLIKEINLVVE